MSVLVELESWRVEKRLSCELYEVRLGTCVEARDESGDDSRTLNDDVRGFR